MNNVSEVHATNQKNSYLESLISKNKGKTLKKDYLDHIVDKKAYNTSKTHVLFIYLGIPVIVTTMVYFLMYSNPMSLLYSLAIGLMVYTVLVYTYPIPLDSVYKEWEISDKQIVFSSQKEPNMLVLPWYVIAKNADSEILLEDILDVQISSTSMGVHMENSFSFGPWSPKMNPFLQTEYIISIKEKDGSLVTLSSKNSDLMLHTILKFLKANISVEIR